MGFPGSVTIPARRMRLLGLMVSASIVLLGFIAYWPKMDDFFWEDDFVWVQQAQHTLSVKSAIFDSVPSFRPLVRVFFLLCYMVSGHAPLFYHIAALIVHAAIGVLLYYILRTLFKSQIIGFAVSALFVVSDTHSDALYWLSAIAGPLSLLCFLLCLLFWIMYRKGRMPVLSYRVAVAFCALAMLSKEEAVTFPLIIIGTDCVFRLAGDVPFRKRLVQYLPFFVALACYLALMAVFFANPATRPASVQTQLLALGSHTLDNVVSALFFMMFPFMAFGPDPPHAVMAACIVAVFLAGYVLLDKRHFYWAAGWMVLTFLPMSFYGWDFYPDVQVAAIRRYLYTPSVGTLLLMVLMANAVYRRLAGRFPGLRPALVMSGAAVLVAATLGSVVEVRERAGIWNVRFALVEDEVSNIEALNPAISTPAGFYLVNFTQDKNFEPYMLKFIYNNEDIKTFGSWEELESGPGINGKYFMTEKDGFVVDVGSGRSRPLVLTRFLF